MPDFAACSQSKCKKTNTCARYLMERDKHWQTVVTPAPKDCDLYWDTRKGQPFRLDVDRIFDVGGIGKGEI